MRKIAELFRNLSTKGKVFIIIMTSAVLCAMIIVPVFIMYLKDRKEPEPMRITEFEEESFVVEEYPGPYDPDNFEDVGEFKYYYDDEGNLKSMMGIDVSYAQKDIDWHKVKKAGIDFAIIRVGYRGYESGDIHSDEYFEKNITEAVGAGVKAGVYFFSQALTPEEAKEEAEFTLEHIRGYDITFPVVFDWETIGYAPARTDTISADALNSSALEFCKVIEKAGYKPMIYSSLNLLREQYHKYDDRITECELWLAEYKNRPEYPKDFVMWQYTSEGHVDGIQKLVDLDMFFGTGE